VSAIYRIHTPNGLQLADSRVITFLVTELGLDAGNFSEGADVDAYQRAGNLVVTPSQWSRERIISYGFRPEHVLVIPHGVDTSKFSPFTTAQRVTAREALGYGAQDVVFLNVGAPIWNKGMDLIIQAFFAARKTCKTARLLIKDQQSLYGLSAIQMIKDLAGRGAITLDDDSVASIRVLPQTLSIEQLRNLYSVADFYLSPYRAEGFNLPVIEAIACGTQAIVTAGGSTDDFCNEQVAIRIPSTKHQNVTIGNTRIDAYLEPDVPALVAIIQACCEKPERNVHFEFGRVSMLEQFTWRRASRLISALV
jgi:glycosyltransferase involved in cell wall biosynthesis